MNATFTAEEWAILTEAPLLAGAAAATAERGGTTREKFAIREVYAAARELSGESPLLDALAASRPSIDAQHEAEGRERLRAALSIVEKKATPDDADAYKGFVLAVAQTAAEAHREGGFVGIGGVEVTEREQAVLDEIAAVLGVTPE